MKEKSRLFCSLLVALFWIIMPMENAIVASIVFSVCTVVIHNSVNNASKLVDAVLYVFKVLFWLFTVHIVFKVNEKVCTNEDLSKFVLEFIFEKLFEIV